LTVKLEAKRLEFLRELVPHISKIGAFLDPYFPPFQEQLHDLQEAGRALGVDVQEFRVSTDAEMDAAFGVIARRRIGAISVAAGPFFDTRRDKLVAMAARHAVFAIYHFREFTVAGGLVSYGADSRVSYRQIGLYAGAILKGQKPAEMPVLQPTKFELVINLRTAKALSLTVPLTLQVAADERHSCALSRRSERDAIEATDLCIAVGSRPGRPTPTCR
jgi:ABC-type uncharacterized transport system substrate-binding protein